MSNSSKLIAVVKRDCPTCVLVLPVLHDIERRGHSLEVHVEDDPSFAAGLSTVHDASDLGVSYRLDVHAVPTVIRLEEGREAARAVGWNREEWRALTGIADLGADLPAFRPGCGSRTQEPGMRSRLKVHFGNTGLAARRVSLPESADAAEACFDRGWTDGLPVVPPTEERVLDMLDGTTRSPQDVVGLVPPNNVPCTVEKVAINAVMAGCKPEYMPVVLTAIEAALAPECGLHAILATTNAVAPVVMVNGPIARAVGMNSKGNVFGQGNRANAAIGRALQLVVRNVGGGRPGEIDRAVFGNPGKYTFCFAEDEEDDDWESFAASRGFAPAASTVTVFPGDGVTPIVDHMSRTPEDLCRSYVGCLRAVYNAGQVVSVSAFLVVGREHFIVFRDAGWSKQRVWDHLMENTTIPVRDIVSGRAGAFGLSPEEQADPDRPIRKFARGNFNIIRAGGHAGKYSAIISSIGSNDALVPVTREIRP